MDHPARSPRREMLLDRFESMLLNRLEASLRDELESLLWRMDGTCLYGDRAYQWLADHYDALVVQRQALSGPNPR